MGGRPGSLPCSAEAKKDVGGKDRNELVRADNLVIWTTPPSPKEMQVAMEIVKPKMITLVCAHPFLEGPDAFIARLTGLLKYAITHRSGKVTYGELDAATAQRLVTVEQGLRWLVSSGRIILVRQKEEQLWVAAGKPIKDHGDAASKWTNVKDLLTETAAYRAHFKTADPASLISS